MWENYVARNGVCEDSHCGVRVMVMTSMAAGRGPPPVFAAAAERRSHRAYSYHFILTVSYASPFFSYVICSSASMRLFMQKYFLFYQIITIIILKSTIVCLRDGVARNDAHNTMPRRRMERLIADTEIFLF